MFCHHDSGYQLGLSDAMKECNELGDGWSITRKTGHSIVCSKVSYLKNCQNCDVWRLYAWEDGACEKLNKNKCNPNMTKAGKYYCGYEPCRKGGALKFGGDWGKKVNLYIDLRRFEVMKIEYCIFPIILFQIIILYSISD